MNTASGGKVLCEVQGVQVIQEPDLRIHYVADMDVDCDGATLSYRIDNKIPPALDNIHASAGYPSGAWWNVLVRDPMEHNRPYVDELGYCISMTSYQDRTFTALDRRR